MARVFTDAGGQSLASASQKLLMLDTFSVAFWLFRTATPVATADITSAIGPTQDGWQIQLLTSNLIRAFILGTTTNKVRDSSTAPALNTWVHVVITHNSTGLLSTDFTFYFNGKSEAGTNNASLAGTHTNNAFPLIIGQATNGANRAPPATIGPIAYWSRALSPAECLALAGGAHPLRFKEGLAEMFDMQTAHGEEGWLGKLYLVQSATNPTSAAVNPPVESPPFSLLETRLNVRPTVRSRARYSVVASAAVAAPRAPLQVTAKKRRLRKLVAKVQRSPRTQSVSASRAPSKPIVQVQPKKRKRRAGSGKLLRAPVQRSFAPDKPQLVVAGRKRRKRTAPDTLLITGARRSPTKPPKTLTQVTPKRKRRRTGDTLLLTGARRATPTATQRPIRPIKVVATKKRRQKPKPAQLLKAARGATPAAAQRPVKPLTQVKPPKRRRRRGETKLVTGARRAAVVATPARRASLTVAAPKKRRKRTADATIITGARRAAAKKRSPIAIVQPKRKRRAKPQTQRLSTRGRGGAAALARAILKSVATIALGPSRTSSIAGYTVDKKTIALSAAKSKSVSLRASQSGTIVLKPLNTAKPMSTFNSSIVSVVAGDDLDVVRTVTAIPATQTLAQAWLTFKSNLSAADPGLLQKVILPGAVAGQGQITDTGASGTGSLLFQLSQADTLALPIGVNVAYDIKVKTSAGKIYTAEQGMYLAAKRVTISTS